MVYGKLPIKHQLELLRYGLTHSAFGL